MPRACIPDARLFASAECLYLPFLAPRAVVEFSAVKYARVRKQDGTRGPSDGRDQTEEKELKDPQNGRLWNLGSMAASPVYTRRQHRDRAGGLLQTSSRLGSASDLMHGHSAMRARYADIYDFTRQSIRHSSSNSAAVALEHPPDDLLMSERTKETSSNYVQRQEPPTIPEKIRRSRLDIKRADILGKDRRLLDRLIHRQRNRDASALFVNGNYRSLRRRIANLEHWAVRSLDLSNCVGGDARNKDIFGAFTALNRRVYPRIQPYVAKIRIYHHRQHVRWRQMLFDGVGHDNVGALWKNWKNTPLRVRNNYWRLLLLYLLDRRPGRTLMYLEMLTSHLKLDHLDRTIIADALGHLSRLHVGKIYGANCDWEPENDADANAKRFVPAFCQIFRAVLADQPQICSQDLLYNIAILATGDDLKRSFDLLIETRTALNFDTLLHYTSAFARTGETGYALKSLDELAARLGRSTWETVVDRERLRWSCALLLRNSMRNGQNYHDTPIIISRFVHLGLKMDTLLYNVVMHNAMDAGDYSTAFKVYEALESNDLQPTNHTFSILLHGCTRQSNPSRFQNFAEHCLKKARELQDPWLASDYLYYQYVRLQGNTNKISTEHASTILWQTYLKLFSPAPILRLLSLPQTSPPHAPPPDPSFQLLDPPPMALYIMLHSHIRLLQTLPPTRLQSFLQSFHSHLTHAPHPSLAALATNPLIWNTFLHAFCTTQQFNSASTLIKHMLDRGPAPNTYSWNIFMQAFFKSSQLKAADRVWQIMRETKVKPDQYTYGVLLRGFAKAQLVERIGEVVGRVEEEGDMHPEVLRALAGVKDRKRLMAVLEAARAEQEVREKEAAEEKMERDRERWEAPDFDQDGLGVGELDETQMQRLLDGDRTSGIGAEERSAQSLSNAQLRMLFPPTRVATAPIRRINTAQIRRRANSGGKPGASPRRERVQEMPSFRTRAHFGLRLRKMAG